MSISLVVLRFEVADDLPGPQGLDYCAPGFMACKEMSISDKGKLASGEDKEPMSTDSISEEKMKVHRGERYVHDISIETHATSGDKDTNLDSGHGDEKEEKSGGQGKVAFFCGNPIVEIIQGIIHIYKNNDMTLLTEGVYRSEMICMLSVPAKMTCKDLMEFVAPSEEFIECVKIIRDSNPNQYMVLVKFRNQGLADDFYDTYNGQPYNLLEEEGGSLPCEGLTELPKCPVCLERMDESVEGVLTILCNHSFHGSCLSKWSDTTCPVCRYCQTPQPVDDNKCFECDSSESLWICLICGHIGCGRYLRSHAKRHFQETQHTYSLELGTQRVWDYTGDNFVHRLIQNKADGKLVEYGTGQQVADEEKMDSLSLEYTYLLTSQLEKQRLYFQDKITQIEKDAVEEMSNMEERTKKTLEECKKLEFKLTEVEQEKKNLEKKYTQVASKVGKLAKDLKDEQELNKCLLGNQKLWQEKLQQTEDKLKDVEATRQQELQDGQLFLGEGSSPKHQSKGKSRRKK
ncbi:BRCA1-associated protein [Stylophora pistillata]|uniref:BRCA1-associated protein n=1 Tax=Stylophora pistillata TaxID=50429 RepID=A0A2B4RS89_STYPI|nr:BRCA1-associated protein [Stylophora pistillata]